jgi:hypothetical protein
MPGNALRTPVLAACSRLGYNGHRLKETRFRQPQVAVTKSCDNRWLLGKPGFWWSYDRNRLEQPLQVDR